LRHAPPVAALLLLLPLLAATGCIDPAAPGDPVSPAHFAANRCFAIGASAPGRWRPLLLSVSEAGDGYEVGRRGPRGAAAFFFKPSRLGSYLLYDDGASHLTSDGRTLVRKAHLLSDVLLLDDAFESDAEWDLEHVGRFPERRLRLRHRRSGRYLATDGLVDAPEQAAGIWLVPRDDCAPFPEATLDASGGVERKTFPDGTLFGFVDTHSHILSNFSFGGGGIFHGAPFHPLGIEHALPDCAPFHGVDGRQDIFGFGFDNPDLPADQFLLALVFGETPTPNHATAGWPAFTDWPDAHRSSTHQTQYYRWLERAWLSGLRLVVQHATSNQVICDFVTGLGLQDVRYSCNDMVAVDRILAETYAMQDYIDAQEGGPGRGWFRIVTSPAEAREVIAAGKMAVVLGIETSNLFDCFLVPSAEFPACSEQDVVDRLEHYHDLGVRAVFPVHKFDNAFSAGDGQKLFIELGNVIQTGHFSNFTPECDPDVPSVFDKGPASFPGLIEPRDDYFAPPPVDVTGFADDPIATVFPFVSVLLEPPGQEEVCQKAGLTALGEFLMEQLMRRGMIIEVDHMPRRSYKRAFEILRQHDYPAAGTHGLNNSGEIYRLGGVSKTGLGRCQSASRSGTMADRLLERVALVAEEGGYPAEGFGFDLNGFAGAPGPRFGPEGVCGSVPQEDPITYPFASYAGDVTFTQPRLGERMVDFNTEGFVHIGMVAELIEDARRDGVPDADLEPLFRSAEGYIRMWEKAERRARALWP